METLQAMFVESATVIAAASLIVNGLLTLAAFTPTDKDDKVLGRIKNVLDKFNPVKKA